MSSPLPPEDTAQTQTAPSNNPARSKLNLMLPLLLLPLLPMLLVLWNWGNSSTEVGYFAGNSNVGEILAGQRYGQTFTPIYPSLSGITVAVGDYARVNTGTLTLRLYEAGSSEQIAHADVPTEGFSNNPRVLFEFPPLGAETRGKLLRFDIEDQNGVAFQNAVTLFSSNTNSYGGGNAYFNGRAEPDADILFGMRYSVSPPAIWGAQIANWAGSVSPVLALLAGIGLFGVVGGVVWILVVLAGRVRDALAGVAAPPPTRAGLLPLALLTLLGLSNGLTWAIFTPPWHGPDEPAHFGYAAALAKQGLGSEGIPDPVIRASVVASMDRHQFLRYVPWAPDPGGSADGFLARPGYFNDTFWGQLRQRQPYYALLGAVFSLPGLAPDGASWPDARQVDTLLFAGRIASALLQAIIVALAWLAGRSLGIRGASSAIALLVALLPMPAFIHAMINNDVLASVAGAILGLYAVRAMLRPRLIDLPLLLVGVALVVFSKPSALPMIGLALLAPLVGLWLRAGRTIKLVLGAATLLVLALPVVAFYASLDRSSYARDWVNSSYIPAARVATAASDGSYALSPGTVQITQRIPLEAHGALTATATILVRGAGGASALSLGYNALAPTNTVTITTTADWQPISTTLSVPANGGDTLLFYLIDRSGKTQFDNAALLLQAPDGSTVVAGVLQNPSFETAANVVPTNLPGLKPGSLEYLLLDYVADPIALDRFWDKQTSLFRSFFADFGWVAVQLPDWTYLVWGIVVLVALAGGIVALFAKSREEYDPQYKAMFVLFLLLTIGGTLYAYLRTAAGLKSYGSNEFPQGRYMFPLLIPIATAFLLGLRGWWPILRTALPGRRGAVAGTLIVYCGVALLFAYGALAFTSVLAFYYGR